MPHPPRPIFLILLLLATSISGCTYNPPRYWGPPPFLPVSPLMPTPTAVVPPSSAPDTTLYPPTFEDAALVPDWVRPLAPENSFNSLLSPDGRYLLYLAHHPGTRRTSLYSAPVAGGDPLLLGTGSAAEEIFYYSVSADSSRIVYYPDFGDGLYSSTPAGTKAIRLSRNRMSEAAISPDGDWVVYWGEQEGEGEKAGDYALYSVPAIGGDPVRLGAGLTQSGSYKITSDGRHVVYTAADAPGVDAPEQLYRIPIEGGTPAQLNQGAHVRGSNFQISPDDAWVIFGNLYRVPLMGGTPEQLNPKADAENMPWPFNYPQISPDGQWLVFTAGERRENNVMLFSTPLAGGPVVQLNGPLEANENVQSFHISPNGQHVYYTVARLEDEQNGIPYRVPISGGAPTAFAEWDGIYESLDGQWLLPTIWLEGGGSDLYSMPTTGGPAVKLNTLVPEGSAVAWSTVMPDSRTLVYSTSPDAGGGMPTFDGIFIVPLSGGPARPLLGIDGSNRSFDFFFTPDGEQVIADADYDGDGRYALYVVEVSRLLPPTE